MAAPTRGVEVLRDSYTNFATPVFDAAVTFPFRGFHANADGNISFRTIASDNHTITVSAGRFYPYAGIRINTSETTLLATDILLAW